MQLTLEQVAYAYRADEAVLFEGVSAMFEAREMVALTGPSGSGKSTMLDILGAVRVPTRGRSTLRASGGRVLASEEHIRSCAWVLQSNLVFSRRSVLDNVAIGALVHGIPAAEAQRRAWLALETLGILRHGTATVNTLSGGEQQRVTVARCLASPASVILADEPTGNLDAQNTARVMESLRMAAASGKLVLVATHDPAVIGACDRSLGLGGVRSE